MKLYQRNSILLFASLLIICVLLCACKKQPKTEALHSIPLDIEKTQNIHDLNLIKEVEIISLDNQDVLIGNIDKVLYFNKLIYIMDQSAKNSVYIFNENGSFVRAISNYGRAANEYIQLSDIFIDSVDSTLNIVSRIDKKLFVYNITGEHQREVRKLPKSFVSVTKKDGFFAAYMGNFAEDAKQPYILWTMDKDFKLQHSYFEIPQIMKRSMPGGGSVFSNYKDTCYFIMPMDFNVYSIQENNIEVVYTFNLGGNEFPQDAKDQLYDEAERRKLTNRYITRFYHFQETENHLIVQFLYKGEYLLGVYNKRNKQSKVASLNPYNKEYFFSFGNIVGFDEHTIYSVIDASRLKKFWNGQDAYNNYELDYPQQIKNLREKFEIVNEEGNPFLIMYSID